MIGFTNPSPAKTQFVVATLGNLMIPDDGTPSSTSKSKLGVGGALALQYQLKSSRWSLDGGLVSAPRTWSSTVGTFESTYAMNTLQIPVGLRWSSDYFTAAAGGYMSMVSGQVTRGLNGTTSSLSPNDAGLKSDDYGLFAALGTTFPAKKKYAFTIETRYNYGMPDVSTGLYTLFASDVQIWLGVRFSRGN